MVFAQEMKVKALDQVHECHTEHADLWRDLDLLYRGGIYLKRQAQRFLAKRPKEVATVFAERVARFSYQNILGTSAGWYLSAAFDPHPQIVMGDGTEIDPKGWWAEFLKNSTGAGQSLVEVFTDVMLDLMLYRASYVLTDLPASDPAAFQDRAAQKAAGALDPFVVHYHPKDVLNWEKDAKGLKWAVIKTEDHVAEFGGQEHELYRWYYFDREFYAVYQAEEVAEKKPEMARLVASGRHPLADVKRCPLRRIEVKDGLWLAHRAYLPVLDHLNQDNSYAWALFMSNLPVPVIKGEYKGSATLSETSFIHLPEGGAFEFAEPSGTSFQCSADRCSTLREEIHRQMYLQAQSRSESATAAAQSGLSKQMDMSPSNKVLSGFGDVLKAGMVGVLSDVAAAHGEAVEFDVIGFCFPDENDTELSTLNDQSLDDIPSETFQRERYKRRIRAVMPDMRAELASKCDAEVDSGPTPEERKQASQQAMQERMAARLSVAAKAA